MVEEPNGEDELKASKNMSGPDMAMRILELITENKEDEETLRKLYEQALKLYSKPKRPKK